MEVIDLGTLLIDDVIDILLQEGYLRSLIGSHGAACFVLVRPIMAPEFYHRLIENSDTIDATTRDHVAFMMFYGDKSGVTYEEEGFYNTSRAKYRLFGLSVSGNESAQLESGDGFRKLRFSPTLAEELRYSPKSVNYPLLSHHMSRASTRIMELYDISESSLPCLLFVDANRPKESLVVRLDPADPLSSLYISTLRPLSEYFRRLSSFFELRDHLNEIREERKRMETAIADLPREIDILERTLILWKTTDSPDKARQKSRLIFLEAFLRSLEEDIKDIEAIVKAVEDLPGHVSNRTEIIQRGKEITLLESMESAIKKTLSTEQLCSLEDPHVRKWRSLVRRIKQKEDALLVRVTKMFQEQVSITKDNIESPSDYRNLLANKQQLETNLTRAHEFLDKHMLDELNALAADVKYREKTLREDGYDDSILTESYPSAFSVIHTMYQRKLLGIIVDKEQSGGKPAGRPGIPKEDLEYRLQKAREAEAIKQDRPELTWKEIAKMIDWKFKATKGGVKLLEDARNRLQRLESLN